MLITLAVAIAVAAVMLAAVLALRRRGGSDDLIAPPRGLSARPRPEPPPPPPGWSEGAAPIHGLPDDVAAEARQLLAQNRRIEAVKLVRAATGCSLEQAVERVERI